jgi:hypothetical protein
MQIKMLIQSEAMKSIQFNLILIVNFIPPPDLKSFLYINRPLFTIPPGYNQSFHTVPGKKKKEEVTVSSSEVYYPSPVCCAVSLYCLSSSSLHDHLYLVSLPDFTTPMHPLG